MSINLPGILVQFINMVGFEFPEGQETELMQWAVKYQNFADALTTLVDSVSQAADHVRSQNQGPALEAYSANFEGDASPKDVAVQGSKAAKITGTIMMVIGAAILVLKILMIVDLSVFAAKFWAAIAAIPATFGASLGWIPPARMLCKKLIGIGIKMASQKVLG